ncbi:cation:H+ antiporter [Prauserella shujinwangii]|uniref:Cation:H+ antiporter n=1 Tax=Prauserella shujinwangii TaxID=1453103 RepID=A0A2T0LTS2_9PSEU|nr:cation transporter [Prauserella shujinwangii]PRX47131.1 cation:H+ antiporter [Prauserella shujinwangii]
MADTRAPMADTRAPMADTRAPMADTRAPVADTRACVVSGGSGYPGPMSVLTQPWPLGWAIAVFVLAGALTVVCSIRLASLGDALADRTGWGEAFFGAVFFGVASSLSGITMTGVSAAQGQPELAYSNAVGGIAVQTLAIVAADAAHRRVNLEHAAASVRNLLFGCLLIVLLGTGLLASLSPDVTVAGVHPASFVMVALYAGGLKLIHDQREPMWRAVSTRETKPDEPEDHGALGRRRTRTLWGEFVLIAAVVVVGGWAIARAAESLVVQTGLAAGLVGAIFMGVVNALPETVTAVAAVRRGALTLAVAAVIGGNSLDALNLVLGDVVFRAGSLFHAATPDQLFLTGSALLMTAVLLGGLLVRQRRGWWRLGFDGVMLAAIYATAVLILAF